MATYTPLLADPNDPDSIAQWAREITELLSGYLSIGEPVSENVGIFPNGVKGHMLGSFVTVTIGQGYGLDANVPCVHNLNVENKGVGAGPTDMNVGWIPVRWEHNGVGCAGAGIETVSCNYEDGTITANSIELRFYAAAPRSVIQENPLYVTLWFFPTTR